jgi:hypothetical protein
MRINYLIIASALTGCKKETPAAPENNQLLVAPIQTGQGISTIPDTDGAKQNFRLRKDVKAHTGEESEDGEEAPSVTILPDGSGQEGVKKEVPEQDKENAAGSSSKETTEAQVSAKKEVNQQTDSEKSAGNSKSDDSEVLEANKKNAEPDNKNGSPINVDEGNTGNVEEGNTGS